MPVDLSPIIPVDYDAITRAAHQQIRQEWLDTGVTIEELERGDRISELYGYMVGIGRSDEEVISQLQNVTDRELILLEKQYLPDSVK